MYTRKDDGLLDSENIIKSAYALLLIFLVWLATEVKNVAPISNSLDKLVVSVENIGIALVEIKEINEEDHHILGTQGIKNNAIITQAIAEGNLRLEQLEEDVDKANVYLDRCKETLPLWEKHLYQRSTP